MSRTHSQGHHKNQAAPAARPARPRETDYVNTAGHGVGARPAKLTGAGKGRTMPYLGGDPLSPAYHRPPCLDQFASYRSWKCDREKCRADNCDPWCDSERRERQNQAAYLAQLLQEL